MLGAQRVRTKQAFTAGIAVAVLVACTTPETSTRGAEEPPVDALDDVRALASRFVDPRTSGPILGAGTAAAHGVELPALANDETALAARADSSMRLRFRLIGAARSPKEDLDGLALHRDALGRGAHLVRRVAEDGVEDELLFTEKPELERVGWEIDLEHVAGLRLVGSVLELLDSTGTPRMRVVAPHVYEAAREGAPSRSKDLAIDVEGCAIERGGPLPWDRPVVDPGGSRCTLWVSWSGVTYPALVDPVWSATTTDLAGDHERGTATLLPAGRVLVAGDGYSKYAEVFNASSNAWSVCNPNVPAATDRAATRLPSGEVMLIGGDVTFAAPTVAVYTIDPQLCTLGIPAGLQVGRASHVLETLLDGRILVAGGDANDATAETYSDASGWVPTQPMLERRSGARSTRLPDGRVLVAGGLRPDFTPIDSTEIFDPATNAWTAGPNLAKGRWQSPAVTDAKGRFLLFGGYSIGAPETSVEALDPTTLTFHTLPFALAQNHQGGAAVELASGHVLVVGGGTPGTNYAELLHRDTDVIVGTAKTLDHRTFTTATLLEDGRVLITGRSDSYGPHRSELYRPDDLGDACTVDVTCSSGFCVDGVCCDAACDGPCDACTGALKGSGIDGKCGPVAEETDPKGACATESTSTCGTRGVCDGAGHCALYGSETACGPPACADGTATKARCDGAGTCVTTAESCGPFICSGGGCGTSCNGDETCAAGAWCRAADTTCVPVKADGSACARDGECASGACLASRCATTNACLGSQFVDASGALIECAPFACTPLGCLDACSSVLQCSEPFVCDAEGACVVPQAPTVASGCTLAPGQRGAAPIVFLATGLALSICARRRRRSE
ncbi:MAG: Dickkopf N-terminal cysteine-rich domain-containing protein [Polyangiaceae bacterium]